MHQIRHIQENISNVKRWSSYLEPTLIKEIHFNERVCEERMGVVVAVPVLASRGRTTLMSTEHKTNKSVCVNQPGQLDAVPLFALM